jgi:hypothetical protein
MLSEEIVPIYTDKQNTRTQTTKLLIVKQVVHIVKSKAVPLHSMKARGEGEEVPAVPIW